MAGDNDVEVTLGAVSDNARRLLADAEALFELHRYQSATALAILAIEEVGKHYMVKWGFGDKGDVARFVVGRHSHKALC